MSNYIPKYNSGKFCPFSKMNCRPDCASFRSSDFCMLIDGCLGPGQKYNVLPLKKEQNLPKQISFGPFLTDMNDDVLTATKFLISHYERTNQPFVWIDKDEIEEFSEQIKIPPDRIQKTIEDLKSEKIAYLRYDKVYMKWELHLYKDFIERARHV